MGRESCLKSGDSPPPVGTGSCITQGRGHGDQGVEGRRGLEEKQQQGREEPCKGVSFKRGIGKGKGGGKYVTRRIEG